MEAVINARTDLRLRYVDIGDWRSPVAQQYGVTRLPTLWLWSDGELVADETQATVRALNSQR